MTKAVAGRVVVGVDDSASGRAALRAAVAQARPTGREVVAVRAYESPRRPCSTERGHPVDRREKDEVRRTYAHAVGGVPLGVRVRVVVAVGRPGEVLVAAAHLRDDLLVVGTPSDPGPRHLWPRRWFRRSVCGYCTGHAVCPVLTVPSGAFADVVGAGEPAASRAPAETADVAPRAPAPSRRAWEPDDARAWPERSCCCSAQPMVRAVLPVGGGQAADLFLCGHHYRASVGPLAIADALVTFRERSALLSLAQQK
ncbi:universal stress protein [Streptomyces sp. NPDC051985]|uniref:universal stress protein n=1 Tax=Streptomyces sp. NPDC051985 TaxID=3155807 RepID=UPI0034456ED9